MKSLSKDKVLRWVSGPQSQGGSGGGGGSADLAGYATQIWTEQNYVSKEFFSSLFKTYDANGNEVLPNDTETVIDNIKAMFGFWTEQYVSALGQGSGGGGGGASALSDLLDVEISNPTNGQSLVYDAALSKWVNATGSGVDMDTVWRYLAQSSTQQIDISHLTTALSGYATQQWVGQNYLSKTDAASTYLSIEFFNRLFQAYEGTGSSAIRVNPNDTTSTIDNIKAMFGFWTEQYISALGQGTGGGGGGGASALSDLLDVEINNPTNGQSLVYDSALSKWVNAAGSGVDMDTVWRYLAQSSTQQIDISHLETALSWYATETWVTGKGYITGSGSITGNAGSATKLQTPRTLWGQSFDGTANISGTLSGVSGINFSSSGHFRIDEWGNFRATTNTDNNTWNVIRYDGGGALTVSASSGDTTIGGNLKGTNKIEGFIAIELNSTGASSGHGGYIDFHYKGSSADYTTRLIEESSGTLKLVGSLYATGGVTALSDARHKTIIKDAAISVEQIAKMPAVVYQWNDGREDNGLHVGSIAQDWQRVLPEVVMRANDEEGTLSMQYGVAALVSSIITARKVVDHERRIAELEHENKELKLKLKIV